MQDIHINRDIRDFKPRIAGPFTLRNIVGLIIAAALGGPTFALCRSLGVNLDISIICIILGAVPGFLVGWVKIAGLPFEKGIVKVINTNFGRTRYLYKSENIYINEKRKTVLPVVKKGKSNIKFYS